MRVFIYDEKATEPNFSVSGVYDKGMFTWKEKKGLFGKTEKHMDIIWDKTKRFPIGKKGAMENCAKSIFDGMNYVQVGWDETDLSKITPDERLLSRANFVRDYEGMRLDDENKITPPGNWFATWGPWLMALVIIVGVVALVFEGNAFSNVLAPMVQNFSKMAQDNHVLLHYILNKTTNTIK
jgi:hypothetical protein